MKILRTPIINAISATRNSDAIIDDAGRRELDHRERHKPIMAAITSATEIKPIQSGITSARY